MLILIHFGLPAPGKKEEEESKKDDYTENDKEIHKVWILTLRTSYYDKMYSYKLDMRKDFIVHKGDIESCRDYINAML